MKKLLCALAAPLVLLMACTNNKGWQAEAPLYRCEAGIEFRARFVDDSAVLDGNGPANGYDVLYRDAGGTGIQTHYRNPRIRAEFGWARAGERRFCATPCCRWWCAVCEIDQANTGQRTQRLISL